MNEHIYENRTNKMVTVTLPSEDNKTAAEKVFTPYSRLELSWPGLDQYVPHMLTKVSSTIIVQEWCLRCCF